MAYTDFDFYRNSYFGDELTNENCDKWLTAASDELDSFTFCRLAYAFPVVQQHADKVKKAVCALAEALYRIDVQQRAASAQRAPDGTYRGTVASVSSGKESISYSTSPASASIYALAASNMQARETLVRNIVATYLANVPDSTGVNLLFAGGVKCVRQNCNFV